MVLEVINIGRQRWREKNEEVELITSNNLSDILQDERKECEKRSSEAKETSYSKDRDAPFVQMVEVEEKMVWW